MKGDSRSCSGATTENLPGTNAMPREGQELWGNFAVVAAPPSTLDSEYEVVWFRFNTDEKRHLESLGVVLAQRIQSLGQPLHVLIEQA